MLFPTLLEDSWQVTSDALNEQTARHSTLTKNMHENFVIRFRDLQLKKPLITYMCAVRRPV